MAINKQHTPCLGFFLSQGYMSKQTFSHGGTWIHRWGQSEKQFAEPTWYSVILSNYYENIAKDIYWDSAVATYGLKMAQPTTSILRIVHHMTPNGLTDYRHVDGNTDSTWSNLVDKEAHDLALISQMSPLQRTAHRTAFELKRRIDYQEAERSFHKNRSVTVEFILDGLEKVELAWQNGKIDEVKRSQEILVGLLHREADIQYYRVVSLFNTFGATKAERVLRISRMKSLNRHAKAVLIDLRDDAVKSDEPLTKVRAEEALQILAVADSVLEETVRPPYGVSYHQYLLEEMLKIKTKGGQQWATLTHGGPDAAAEMAEIKSWVDEGETAINNSDREKCYEMGVNLAQLLHLDGKENIYRAIGWILLAINPTEGRRRVLAHRGRDALLNYVPSLDVPEDGVMKVKWLRIAEALVLEVDTQANAAKASGITVVCGTNAVGLGP